MAATMNKKGYLMSAKMARQLQDLLKRRDRRPIVRRYSKSGQGVTGPLFF